MKTTKEKLEERLQIQRNVDFLCTMLDKAEAEKNSKQITDIQEKLYRELQKLDGDTIEVRTEQFS